MKHTLLVIALLVLLAPAVLFAQSALTLLDLPQSLNP